MNYIVLDLEFNQFFPFPTGKKATAIPECPFEIIQIGAVKLNDTFAEMGSFNQMIHPVLYPRLHPFVEKITGISASDLKGKPSFAEAYDKFLQFIGKEPAILCTWGADDVKFLFRNIYYHQLNADALTNQYFNIQSLASVYLKKEPGKAIGLKNAVEELQIPIAAPFHNALHDAQYTAKILEIMRPATLQPDTFLPEMLLAIKSKRTRTNTKALLHAVTENFGRELSDTEKQLVKMAYSMGKKHLFDAAAAPAEKAAPSAKNDKQK